MCKVTMTFGICATGMKRQMSKDQKHRHRNMSRTALWFVFLYYRISSMNRETKKQLKTYQCCRRTMQLSNERESRSKDILGWYRAWQMAGSSLFARCSFFLMLSLFVVFFLSFFLSNIRRTSQKSLHGRSLKNQQMKCWQVIWQNQFWKHLSSNCYQSQIALLQIWKDCNAQKVHLTLPWTVKT